MEDRKESKVVGVRIPGEAIPGEPTAADVASEMGWTADQAEFERRNPGKPWVDAATYLKRQREFNDKLKDKLDNVEGTVLNIKKHFDKQLEIEKKKMKAEVDALREKRVDAIRDGDVEAVDAIDAEIAQASKADVADEPIPEIKEWQARNQWYLEDERLQKIADSIAVRVQGEGITDPKKILAEVDSLLAADVKAYNESKRGKAAADPVDTEGGSNRSGKKTHTFADLSQIQQDICRTFVKKGLMTQEKYIKELEEQGELS